MDANNLRELDTRGYRFTWNNKRREGFIKEKLDRFVANPGWWAIYPNAIVENFIWDDSDHIPMILHIKGDDEDFRGSFRDDARPIRFETRWLHHDDFNSSVCNSWGVLKAKLSEWLG